MKPDSKITINELISTHPGAISIFMRRRLLCIGCPANTFHTLEDVSRLYGISLKQLQEELREAIGSRKKPTAKER